MICEGCGISVEPFAAMPGDVCVDCYVIEGTEARTLVEVVESWGAMVGAESGAVRVETIAAIGGGIFGLYVAGHVIVWAARVLGGVF